MANTALDGTPVRTNGELPQVGDTVPDFTLVGVDLAEFGPDDLSGRVVLNIFPSIGTGVCARSVRTFNERAAGLDDTTVVCVSVDLPFAQSGFCAAEGIDRVRMGSAFRTSFPEDFGVRLQSGAFEGLLARAVVVYDADRRVLYSQVVPEIADEPDYDAALASLG
jgi:thiol peroxidase